MEDNAGKFFISDGVLKDSINPEYTDIVKNKVIYEVIRVINGVPLFFEDHYSRLEGSAHSIDKVLGITAIELKKQIKLVIDANGNNCCNVKVTVYEDVGLEKYLLYISKSYYPSMEEVNRGVQVGLLQWERQNPNVKILNQSYKAAVSAKIREGGFFEVLLVNNEGNITEGSKSNVFFVMQNKIFTTPESYVLKGVTRKYVFEACRNAGYDVVETLINTDGLKNVEGLFLSGTSIKVLPVSCIDEKTYDSSIHSVITSVQKEFDRIVKKYIDTNVNIW